MKYIKGNGGIIACPCDASDAVIHNSDYVCKHSGGDGAVREFMNTYLIINLFDVYNERFQDTLC